MIQFFKNYFWKQVKKYGLKVVIIGIIGKIISMTTVFVGIPYWFWNSTLLPETDPRTEVILRLHPDSSNESHLELIENTVSEAGGYGGVLCNALWMRGWDDRIKPGMYRINDVLTMGEVAEKLAIGDRSDVKVIVPSHRNIEIVAGQIASYTIADSAEVLDLIKDEDMRWKIIPNTYNMWWESDANAVVDRLLRESDKWWTEERITLAKKKGLTPEEAVILASIVQSETKNIKEARTVAGLYLNRLKKGMKLQADPTVIYAVGDFTITRVLKDHLEYDSPYNTYLYKGLTPGTILTPEPTFVDAVLHAENHKYLYMCAKPGGNQLHAFAKTFRQHKKNAKAFQKWLNSQGIYK
ncbi:MAG: aminodeoxychorismate lyase [Crocinitomicaceae bacterium]|nr:aminodeoxychorismate lyase [Crocinitomicaceae bacterium]